MIAFGVGFVLLGVAAELIGGTNFRHFFDWRYPAATVRGDDIRIKVLGVRLLFLVGVALLALGGMAWLARAAT